MLWIQLADGKNLTFTFRSGDTKAELDEIIHRSAMAKLSMGAAGYTANGLRESESPSGRNGRRLMRVSRSEHQCGRDWARWGKFLCVLAMLLSGGRVPAPEKPLSADDLIDSVEQWARENLDDEVLQALGPVDRDRVRAVLADLQTRFQGNSVYDLSALKESASALVPLLRQFEETDPLAQWLQTRLDYLDAADELRRDAQSTPPKPGVAPPPPTPQRQRAVWNKQLEKRPLPPRAQSYVPQLKPFFAAEKVPPELVWLAEVESSFNPKVRSPAGAEGMFQLMKPTAKRLGLSTSLPDERLNPEKSARAAARYLRYLHGRFGDWRLALAAYNAGEGRVEALLKNARSRSYDDIFNRLPAETQMYVPKYEATLKKREGLTFADLKVPKG
jgi:membrane-bound lytic murein transglycosylase D